MGPDGRVAAVASLHHLHVERNPGDERYPQLVRQLLATAFTEQLEVFAGGGGEPGHVLDDPDHRHEAAAGHIRHSSGHLLGGLLRRRDHHHLGLGK